MRIKVEYNLCNKKQAKYFKSKNAATLFIKGMRKNYEATDFELLRVIRLGDSKGIVK